MPLRLRVAAASRIWAKDIPLPFLLARTPLSDRVPGCTRIVTWSPSTAYSRVSPGLMRKALRIFPGIVVCPLLVTVECCIGSILTISWIPYLVIIPYLTPRRQVQNTRLISSEPNQRPEDRVSFKVSRSEERIVGFPWTWIALHACHE